MGRKYIKLLLALTVVLNFMGLQAGYAQTDPLPPDDGPPVIQVVGGVPAQPGAWPWQVLLRRTGFPVCGGSLIDINYVLTAAHCVDGEPAGVFTIVLGEHDHTINEGTEQTRSVSQLIMHPSYNPSTYDNDIALLRLNAPATLNSRVRLVSLLETHQNDALFRPGTIATTTGWGNTTEGGNTSNVLRQVAVPIVSNEICNQPVSYDGVITANMVCAGRPEGGVDSCQGDSGGPLVVPNSVGGWLLGGIVSWGWGCAQPNKYGVYTRVANYRTWITSIIGPPPLSLPNLYVIKKTNTGSGTTEVHALNGATRYQSYLLQTGTALAPTGNDNAWAFAVADYNRDGALDVYTIKKTNTGSGTTEVHVLNGATRYQSYLLQTGTALAPAGNDNAWAFAVADYNRDGVSDVYAIKKTNTGSGTTEVHVLNGATRYQTYLLQTGTALAPAGNDNAWAFTVADYNRDGVSDVYAIKKTNTGSGTTEVHVLNGAARYRSFLLQTDTALAPAGNDNAWAFAVADYSQDGVPDVYAIKKTNTGSGTTEVHVLNGAARYRSFLLQTDTALAPAGNDNAWAFAVR